MKRTLLILCTILICMVGVALGQNANAFNKDSVTKNKKPKIYYSIVQDKCGVMTQIYFSTTISEETINKATETGKDTKLYKKLSKVEGLSAFYIWGDDDNNQLNIFTDVPPPSVLMVILQAVSAVHETVAPDAQFIMMGPSSVTERCVFN